MVHFEFTEKNKFNHFILPIGYRGKQIKKFLEKIKLENCKIDIIETGLDTSIAKRIYSVKNFIKSESFIILNGDAIFHTNLDKIFKIMSQKKRI